MELEEPFRRYSLQENGQYVLQGVENFSDYRSVPTVPVDFQGLPANVRAVHKPDNNSAWRKYSLEDRRNLQSGIVPELRPYYSMPVPIPVQMTRSLRPVQEVQPIVVENPNSGYPQSLHVQTVKRRHLQKARESQSLGYAPSSLQSTMYVENPEHPIPRSHSPQPYLLPTQSQIQSVPSMYTFQDGEFPSQQCSPQYLPVTSQLMQPNTHVQPQVSWPSMSPVQMVHPFQQLQPSVPNGVQMVPLQVVPGTGQMAYRANSLEDEVFVTYQPYEAPYEEAWLDSSNSEQDNSFDTNANYSREEVLHGGMDQTAVVEEEPYVGLKRLPRAKIENNITAEVEEGYVGVHTSTRKRNDEVEESPFGMRKSPACIRKRSNTIEGQRHGIRKLPDTLRGENTNYSSQNPKSVTSRKERKVSFEDEQSHLRRGRTQSSPADVGPKTAAAANPELDVYVPLKRAAARKISPLAIQVKEVGNDEPGNLSEPYVGLRRLPRNRAATMKSTREKRLIEDSETEASRRMSVPARMQTASAPQVQKSEKTRRNSVCPMTAYNLRGSSTVAIDNKIEQAMDLVKSHLMFAVREEVEVLREQIAELIERNNQLEYENGILRAAASAETLAKLAQPRQQPPPSSSS